MFDGMELSTEYLNRLTRMQLEIRGYISGFSCPRLFILEEKNHLDIDIAIKETSILLKIVLWNEEKAQELGTMWDKRNVWDFDLYNYGDLVCESEKNKFTCIKHKEWKIFL